VAIEKWPADVYSGPFYLGFIVVPSAGFEPVVQANTIVNYGIESQLA
jgi:hypothetical protein